MMNKSINTEVMGISETSCIHPLYKSLIIEWQKEKFSDELLPAKEEMIKKISLFIEKINSKLKESLSDENQFLKEIFELDLERLLFVLKDYLRIRLIKIEKYLYFIIKNDMGSILSTDEFEYAFNLFKIKRAYFNQNLYKNIHSDLNEFKDGISSKIIVSHNPNSFSFVKCVLNESLTLNLKEAFTNSEKDYIELMKDEIYCLPNILIKNACEVNQLAYI